MADHGLIQPWSRDVQRLLGSLTGVKSHGPSAKFTYACNKYFCTHFQGLGNISSNTCTHPFSMPKIKHRHMPQNQKSDIGFGLKIKLRTRQNLRLRIRLTVTRSVASDTRGVTQWQWFKIAKAGFWAPTDPDCWRYPCFFSINTDVYVCVCARVYIYIYIYIYIYVYQ